MRERFNAWAIKARAGLRASLMFAAIVLTASAGTTTALMNTTNGMTHVLVLVCLILAVMAAVSLGRKTYTAAIPKEEK